MEKFRKVRRIFINDYAVIPFMICTFGMIMSYWFTRIVNYNFRGSIETFNNITSKYDNMIDPIPWWTIIYFGCYIVWIASFLWVSKQSKDISNRMLFADMLCKLLCTAIFIIYPTTMSRPGVPEGEFASPLMEILYWVDSPDNLFPSMHCTASWFAARYPTRCANIPKWYKAIAWISLFLVFASVLFTKQHVIADIFGGVIAAELCIQLSERLKLYRLFNKLDLGIILEKKNERKQNAGKGK